MPRHRLVFALAAVLWVVVALTAVALIADGDPEDLLLVIPAAIIGVFVLRIRDTRRPDQSSPQG